MRALSTREALDKALAKHGAVEATCGHRIYGPCSQCLAYRLIASGAVLDVTALATDELVDAVAEAWYRREQPPFGPTTEWTDLTAIEQWRWRQSACDNLSALAAVITERAS